MNGMIAVEVQKEVITKLGYLWTVLEYTVPDSSMIDGNRKITVDNVPVRIVAVTDEASQDSEFTVSSDIQAGFQGKSAYEVWLDENPDKTLQDYFDWLQKPAIDIAETVNLQEQARVEAEELRVLAEELRQTNTATAISNAENATENANTAAQNADDARLAIQSDLGAKAFHGYASIEVAKTLKQVEDDTSVKMTNLITNGNFVNGTTGWRFGGNITGTSVADSILSFIGGGHLIATGDNWINQIGRTMAPDGHVLYNIVTARSLMGARFYMGIGFTSYSYDLTDQWGTYSYLGSYDYYNTPTYGAALGNTVEMTNAMCFDLTEIFGAGNEPTKEEMDLLISILGIDYFEGEITIPAQKIMQWQLKLIRKNKNAIIALGGTII
ncbi:MAG: hypothetical protein PHV07_09785 [Oscillospiraceae bacterium]|nr:hypothetical protein [Oscillospiraceae bacterium]